MDTLRKRHNIDTFIDLVENDIIINNITRKTKHQKRNLTKEKTAMEELEERTDIVITNTDKGAAVVIMNTNNYIIA